MAPAAHFELAAERVEHAVFFGLFLIFAEKNSPVAPFVYAVAVAGAAAVVAWLLKKWLSLARAIVAEGKEAAFSADRRRRKSAHGG